MFGPLPPVGSGGGSAVLYRAQQTFNKLYYTTNNHNTIHYMLKLFTLATGHEIRSEKCSDTCQHKIKLVLTFLRNDQMLVKIYYIAAYNLVWILSGFV